MQLLELEQGSPEWLAIRKKHRPASETPVVLGISPFQKPGDLWEVRKGLREVYVSAAMREGTAREDEVRKIAAEQYGEDWSPIVAVEGDYLASLDGISGCGSTVLEIKVSKKTHAAVASGEIPAHYAAQMQHQMMVTQADRAILAAMHPETGAVAYAELVADAEAQHRICDAWDAFWPALSLDTWLDPREAVHDEQDWLEAAQTLLEARKAKAAAEAQEKACIERLDALAQGQMIASGAGIRLVRSVRAGAIDYKALLDGLSVCKSIAEQYRKAQTQTLTIKESA